MNREIQTVNTTIESERIMLTIEAILMFVSFFVY